MSVRPRKAVLFDLDGVIVDSEPVHYDAWIEVFREQGFEVTPRDLDGHVGRPDQEIIPDLVASKSWKPRLSLADLLEAKRQRYEQLLMARRPLRTNVVDLVARLARAGVGTAVVSNSIRRDLDRVLAIAGLGAVVGTTVSRDDVPRPKPWPDPYLKAAAALGVPPASCLVIEDSPTGIAAGHAAGMTVWALEGSLPASELKTADRLFPCHRPLDEVLAWAGPAA